MGLKANIANLNLKYPILSTLPSTQHNMEIHSGLVCCEAGQVEYRN